MSEKFSRIDKEALPDFEKKFVEFVMSHVEVETLEDGQREEKVFELHKGDFPQILDSDRMVLSIFHNGEPDPKYQGITHCIEFMHSRGNEHDSLYWEVQRYSRLTHFNNGLLSSVMSTGYSYSYDTANFDDRAGVEHLLNVASQYVELELVTPVEKTLRV